jgi:hypothetical protein
MAKRSNNGLIAVFSLICRNMVFAPLFYIKMSYESFGRVCCTLRHFSPNKERKQCFSAFLLFCWQ